jgi:hypothetical protein
MTQPTVIFLGPDSSRVPERLPPPKVFIRTLLFSTSKRGRVIESMHVRVARSESKQNFNVWVYGDDKLLPGSGLFVGERVFPLTIIFSRRTTLESFDLRREHTLSKSSQRCWATKTRDAFGRSPFRFLKIMQQRSENLEWGCTLIGAPTQGATFHTWRSARRHRMWTICSS